MDLVDIDKVLDDLELNEDESKIQPTVVPVHSQQPTSTQAADSVPVIETNNNNNNNNSSNGGTGIPSGAAADKPAPKTKSYVNITNVFSSLQEYVNVDIEHIIRAADEPLQTATGESGQKEEPTIVGESAKEAETQPYNVYGDDPDEEDEPEDEPEDEEECTDGCYPINDNLDGGLTSASSITTSSPSSFSSGPLPGSSSSHSSESFITEDKYDNTMSKSRDDDDLDNDGLDDDLNKDEEAKARYEEGAEQLNSSSNKDELDETNNSSPPKAEENSFDLGLSSISSCLYNENTSSSFPGLSNDLCKLDALSSIPSSSVLQESDLSLSYHGDHPTAIKTVGQDEVPANRKPDGINNVISNIAGNPSENQPPVVVGFGSTMDEISDTELDSILQEIDSDFQLRDGAEVITELKPPTAEEEEESEDPAAVVAAKALPDIEDESHDNIANMDNFSQASTVEFAESRIQTDFGTEANTPPASASTNEPPIPASIQSTTAATITTDDSDAEDVTRSAEIPKIGQQQRPNSLDIPVQSLGNVNSTAGQTPPASQLDAVTVDHTAVTISNSSSDDLSPQTYTSTVPPPIAGTPTPAFAGDSKLGKVPPFWIPDSEAPVCMQCQVKFSLIKRRHHCRACGLVLCSTCCSQKAKLEFLGNVEARVCIQCHLILMERPGAIEVQATTTPIPTDMIPDPLDSTSTPPANRPPNPNNPMEYCSVIPPHQQVTSGAVASTSPISVMVPVGVLKREGVPPKNRKDKNVIFSDGIRPGCDLADLDDSWDDKGRASGGPSTSSTSSGSKKLTHHTQSGLSSPPYTPNNDGAGASLRSTSKSPAGSRFLETNSFIPDGADSLPPVYTRNITEIELTEVTNTSQLIARLKSETLQFAVQRNLYVLVKIVKLKCCVNKTVMNFTTRGMHHVGQDEIVILLEYDENATNPQNRLVPKDIFEHMNQIYCQAYRGVAVCELGFSVPNTPTFLGSRDHGGFLYIRPTFQCLLEIKTPPAPYIIGLLIHKWEIPWARVFPLRLMLRLGAQYRYYPSPHVSVPFREPVYGEIAQTIINFLADFRNYSYTLATIRGMYIHMEDRKTQVLIPHNRHDEVVKALNNSSDHILALGGNLSKKADGHLVCIQNLETNCAEVHSYSTQAINIQGQPRKVTGASFLVLNGALKSTSGLQGKCSIVEDGLMVQILPAKMASVRTALHNKQDVEIVCGPIDADETQTETVHIRWIDDDQEFNIDVRSPIDEKQMDGIPSIRVHSGLNYSNASHMIRWTEVFVIQMENESPHEKDTIDIQKIGEQIAKGASTALVPFLDLLSTSGCVKIGLRVTLHQDNVCYETGSLNAKLPPLYMNALDNELIPTLHLQATNLPHGLSKPIILELIFYILDK